MRACRSVCLRQMARGRRAAWVRYGRFLANEKVTVEALTAGWAAPTMAAAAGRHVLAIQDTSEINFHTTAQRRRGLGEIGKGTGHGLLLHAMLAVDARNNSCLGLVGGEIWTRSGRVTVPHAKRPLAQKESQRWVSTAARAKEVLASAAMVTVVADRESDLYEEWASVPGANFHLLTRVMHDRSLVDGGSLYEAAAAMPAVDTASIELRARGPKEVARTANVTLRFGRVTLRRPDLVDRALPPSVSLSLIEVVELEPPPGCEPLHWRLLTTHEVTTAADAWQIVDWYKARWSIEQLFRILKTQGLQLEDSQLHSADSLLKLTAIAARVAAITLQLTQARDGLGDEPVSVAFDDNEIEALDVLNTRVEGNTKLQKNPFPWRSLAWAAWIVAKLGGWDGYPSSRPPGPITFYNGLQYLRPFAHAWSLRNVCTP